MTPFLGSQMGAIQSLPLYPWGYPAIQLTCSQLPENPLAILENEADRGQAPAEQQGIEKRREAGEFQGQD